MTVEKDVTPRTNQGATLTSGTNNKFQAINSARQSSECNWWLVHEWVTPFLERVGTWPMVGTPAWDGLADNDHRKLAACLDAAQHWALRIDTCQQARVDAAHAVAATGDWPAVAQRLLDGRGGAYIERSAS